MIEVDTMNDCTCEQGELGGQVLPMCQSSSAYSTSQDLAPLANVPSPHVQVKVDGIGAAQLMPQQ